jgi:hypothetical protein
MDFVLLQTYNNYIDAHIARGQLEDAGITCWLRDENTVTTNPIWTHAVGGIKLMVVVDELEEARNILKTIKEERTGAFVCRKCSGHNVEYISTPKKPSNWLYAFLSFFLGDFAFAPGKVYHCFDCGHEQEEEVAA